MCIRVAVLDVEYAERRKKCHILFTFSLFYKYRNLESVRICVVYRVTQAEYVIGIRVAVLQECVKRSTGHTHTHTDTGIEQHPRHRYTHTRQEQHPKPPNE